MRFEELTPGVRAVPKGLRWYGRSRASEYKPYLAFARRKHGHSVLNGATEIVIDGFPRSASTFATMAFQTAQRRPVHMAHHLHSPAHLVEAARRGVPCIATIRHPRDAVISCLIREPYISLSEGLSIYARFYEIVARHEQRIVVADFDRITSDFPAVIASTNDRFGTTFASYDQNDEQVSWCFHLIDLRVRGGELARVINADMSGCISSEQLTDGLARHAHEAARAIPEHRVARPSAGRAKPKEALLATYGSPRYRRLRANAERAYERLRAA